MWRSRLRMKSRLMPRRSARALMQVNAACADSCMTSPSLPVSVTAPRPLTSVASICSTSPPISVQARPVASPISLSAATPCCRNLIGPSISRTRSAPIVSLKPSATLSATNFRASLRQHEPISRSRLRTPASRVKWRMISRMPSSLNSSCSVRSGDEKYLGQIVFDVQIVILEHVVLFGIKNLQQRRTRIAAKIRAQLVYFIKQEDGIHGAGFLHHLNDLTRERSDVGAAVPPNFSFVTHAA